MEAKAMATHRHAAEPAGNGLAVQPDLDFPGAVASGHAVFGCA